MGSSSGCMVSEDFQPSMSKLVIDKKPKTCWRSDVPVTYNNENKSRSSLLVERTDGDVSLNHISGNSHYYKFSDFDASEDSEVRILNGQHSENSSIISLESINGDSYEMSITKKSNSRTMTASSSKSKRSLKSFKSPTQSSYSKELSLSTQNNLTPSQQLYTPSGLILGTFKSSSDEFEGYTTQHSDDEEVKISSVKSNEVQGEKNRRSILVSELSFTRPVTEVGISKELTSSLSQEMRTCVPIGKKRIDPQKFLDTFKLLLKEKAVCFNTLNTLQFDVFLLKKLPNPFNAMPLVTTTVAVLHKLNTIEQLKISWLPVVNFLINLEDAYQDKAYHSSWHAADVVSNMAYFISRGWFKRSLNPVHRITSLLAAASHDVDHDGFTNEYHKLAKTPRGKLHPASIQEHHHIKKAAEIRDRAGCDWTTELQTYDSVWIPEKVWKMFTELILGTDPSLYPFSRKPFGALKECNEEELIMSQENILIEILHLSDISNPVKPRWIATKWAAKFYQELQELGTEVRRLGLDIPNLKDSKKMPTLPDTQIFFISNICLPAFEDLATFMPEVKETVKNLHQNLEYWKLEKESLHHKNMVSEEWQLDICHKNYNSISSLFDLETAHISDSDLVFSPS